MKCATCRATLVCQACGEITVQPAYLAPEDEHVADFVLRCLAIWVGWGQTEVGARDLLRLIREGGAQPCDEERILRWLKAVRVVAGTGRNRQVYEIREERISSVVERRRTKSGSR